MGKRLTMVVSAELDWLLDDLACSAGITKADVI